MIGIESIPFISFFFFLFSFVQNNCGGDATCTCGKYE